MRTTDATIERFQALGESEAFLNLQERISRAAKTDRSVILVGERGTGKELAARRLHLLSKRWNEPYVTLNCASLSPTLIESELFGHEAGSFTGATRQRKGRFEMAHGGSLFLDEVGDIPMPAQEKILRVVEYGHMERVGSSTSIQVDVRLIAATNADLPQMAREGTFREDLLDRLSFEVITLPPLRERREDILILAEFFSRRMANELELESFPVFTEIARDQLLDHPWPGNIRELKNVVERMVYRSAGEPIERIVFDPFDSPHRSPPDGDGIDDGGRERAEDVAHGRAAALSAPQASPAPSREAARAPKEEPAESLDDLPLNEAVERYRVRRIKAALRETRFNQRRAAESLGLTYDQFRGYYRKYGDELGG